MILSSPINTINNTDVNGGSTIEAEIATLERLNHEDTRLCDELKSSCRIGHNTKGGGVQQGKASCWALVQGGGISNKGLLAAGKGDHDGTAAAGASESNGSGSGEDDGAGSTPGSRKRAFSK